MSVTASRFSNFFVLRGVLSTVVLALVLCRHQQNSPALWMLVAAYLASNVILPFSPARRFENPALGYGPFFIDITIVTSIYASGNSSPWLLFFYLTIFMATLGQTVPKSFVASIVVSSLYVWFLGKTDGHFLDPEALLPIPLFLATGVLCGYLASEVGRFKRRVCGPENLQKSLDLEFRSYPEGLGQNEPLLLTASEDLAQRFLNLVEDLKAGIWEMAVPSLKIIFVNRQMEAILGFSMEKWLKEEDFWVRHVHPEDREHVTEQCRKAIAEGRDYNVRYRAIKANGETIWLQDIVRVVKDESGRIRRLRGVMVDITEQHQLEEEFLQVQKMEAVGRLAAGIAHDFNNLLTIISGYTQLVQELLGPGNDLGPYMKEILKAGERAGALVRRLMAFTRRQSIEPMLLDLNNVVKSTENMVHRLIGENIEVLTILPSELGAVRSDPGQLEQVIVNLSVNARDAMPNGGKLIFETANVDLDPSYADLHMGVTPGPYVMLAVSDTGSGMDAQTRSHIFEPFFTTKEKGKGTGLGLATVYGFVKQSGGNVWVYTEPGMGTTFKIYLPRETVFVEPPQPMVICATQQRGSETVLVAEDEESIRSLVLGILQSYGYTVLTAGGPNEALRIIKEFNRHIHLLLTDVVMPQMSGRELAEQMTAARPSTKVLYMSGYPDSMIAHFGVLNAGVPILQKPFTPEGLANKVREVLDMAPSSA
jgi:PAS domain S-box-containing protein